MGKWMKIGLAAVMVLGLLAGCGNGGQAGETLALNPAQGRDVAGTVIGESETVELNDEDMAVMHCLLLKGDNDSWLFIDQDYGTLFYAPVPENLTDATGNPLSKDDLKAGNQIDIYGNGIMLESYPGQYPGVMQMVVTAEGSKDDLAEYLELINEVFPEPDMSQPPQLCISYTTSQANTTVVLSGPGNYTWETPSENEGESNVITACGSMVNQWTNIIDVTLEGKTDIAIVSEVMPDEVKAYRWRVSAYMAENADSEPVTVEKDADGRLILKNVEEGYIYGITASWEMGEAEYAFVTGKFPD